MEKRLEKNLYILANNKNKIIYDFIKNNTIDKRKIETIIDYNKINNTKYNLFEIVYIMANGLTGQNPLIYKYDLSDNYFKYNNSIDTSIILEILDTNNQDISYIDFKNSSLQDISSFLFNNNYNPILYINIF